jgi:lipoate-protein ligase A
MGTVARRLRWWVDPPAPGAVNMQRDRELLQRAESDPDFDPCLRLYAWDPPALSLGFHQDDAEVDADALDAIGFGLVRRPTGGAAVLHHREITYAVVARLGVEGLGRGVLEIHGAIAAALSASLLDLGVDARRGGEGRPAGFACFSAAGGHEITVEGRKLVGSALRRTRHAFLQHGSLLTGAGHEQLPRFLRGHSDGVEAEVDALRARTITLADLDVGAFDAERWGEAFARRLGEGLRTGVERAHDAEHPIGRNRRGSELQARPHGE